ncbi:hypothetical protein LTR94_028111, partial [Friedmanniomyces endolithicus]
DGGPREDPKGGFRTAPVPVQGEKVRLRAETFADHYSQARLFFKSQTAPEQAHLASAIVFELSKVSLAHVRERVLANLRNVDEGLAKRVAEGLNLPLPIASKPAVAPIDLDPSPALSIVGKYPDSLQGRKVGVLVADGTDGSSVSKLKKAVEKEGGSVFIVAPKIGGVTLATNEQLAADGQLAGSPSVLFDAVAVLVTDEGCKTLMTEAAATDFVKDAFGHLKAIGLSDEAKPLLDKAGVDRDEAVVALPGDLSDFIKAAKTRLWDREPK